MSEYRQGHCFALPTSTGSTTSYLTRKSSRNHQPSPKPAPFSEAEIDDEILAAFNSEDKPARQPRFSIPSPRITVQQHTPTGSPQHSSFGSSSSMHQQRTSELEIQNRILLEIHKQQTSAGVDIEVKKLQLQEMTNAHLSAEAIEKVKQELHALEKKIEISTAAAMAELKLNSDAAHQRQLHALAEQERRHIESLQQAYLAGTASSVKAGETYRESMNEVTLRFTQALATQSESVNSELRGVAKALIQSREEDIQFKHAIFDEMKGWRELYTKVEKKRIESDQRNAQLIQDAIGTMKSTTTSYQLSVGQV